MESSINHSNKIQDMFPLILCDTDTHGLGLDRVEQFEYVIAIDHQKWSSRNLPFHKASPNPSTCFSFTKAKGIHENFTIPESSKEKAFFIVPPHRKKHVTINVKRLKKGYMPRIVL